MLGKLVSVLLLAGCIAATPVEENWLAGVDPDTLSCDPRGEVFLLLPHFTDCSKFFMCAHGVEVEFNCSTSSLVFDFEHQTCNWPFAAECKLRTPPEEVEGSGEDEFEELGEVETPGVIAVVNAQSAVASPMRSLGFSTILDCLKTDTASKRIAYQGDCQRYWRCNNGLPQAVYCSDGLFFNVQSEQCDFEANVKCHIEEVDELQNEFIVYK